MMLMKPVMSIGVTVSPAPRSVPLPMNITLITNAKSETMRKKPLAMAFTLGVAPITRTMSSAAIHVKAPSSAAMTMANVNDCLAMRSAPARSPAPMARATSAVLPTAKPINATWRKNVN